MVNYGDCVNALRLFLEENGFVVDYVSNSLSVDLKYGPRGSDYTTLGVHICEYIEVYPPGIADLLRVPLADPMAFELVLRTIKECHSALLARGIEDMWSSGWDLRRAVAAVG